MWMSSSALLCKHQLAGLAFAGVPNHSGSLALSAHRCTESDRMKKIIEGVQKFQQGYFPHHKALFEELSQGQNPRVLFVTCSDSRVDPNLITNAHVGEVFVIRNAGNIIPPFGAANGGEGAAVEYALQALDIQHVIVCGHSHCGAMKGLLKRSSLEEKMPIVYDWLEHAEATLKLIRDNYSDRQGEELLDLTIAENVLTQIENLRTYPIVRSKLHQGKLALHAWVYAIETGELLAYDPEKHIFVPPYSNINVEAATAIDERPFRKNFLVWQKNFTTPAAHEEQHPQEPTLEESTAVPDYLPGARRLSREQSERIYRGSY